VPERTNPADFFMRTLSVNYPIQEADRAKLEDLNKYYRILISKMINAENNMIRLEAPKEGDKG